MDVPPVQTQQPVLVAMWPSPCCNGPRAQIPFKLRLLIHALSRWKRTGSSRGRYCKAQGDIQQTYT